MGVRLSDLRRVCQLPVRKNNDIAGLIYGDFASLPVTKLFVDLKISPDIASVGFLIAGIVGSGLHVGTGWLAVAASLLLILYYVLDCVDGEVARWCKVVDVRWGYYDYLFHMLIKPLAFFGVGLGTYREFDNPWFLVAAFVASTATLWLKVFFAIPGVIFVRALLTDPGGKARDFEGDLAAPSKSSGPEGGFPLGANMTTLRALMTNFDISLLLLFAATLGDVLLGASFALPVVGAASLRAIWLVYYALILPLDFLDYLVTYIRKGHFRSEATRLVGLAHHFRPGDEA
jgi:hypothetical protein